MAKKIIICGASRSGKTTLAHMVAEKYDIPLISCDPIVSTFQELYPQLGITHKISNNRDDYMKVCQNFTRFLIEYTTHLDTDDYVIEGFHIDLAMLHETLGETHTIVAMGYPGTTVADKFHITREADALSDDRTMEIADSELEEILTFFIDVSQRLHQIADRCHIRFIDTSSIHMETIQNACESL